MHSVIRRALVGALALALAACERAPASPAGSSATGAPIAAASASAQVAVAPSASASAPAPAPPAPRGPEGKILVFGDSITNADWDGHITPGDKWVTRLGAKSDRI